MSAGAPESAEAFGSCSVRDVVAARELHADVLGLDARETPEGLELKLHLASGHGRTMAWLQDPSGDILSILSEA